MRRHVRLEPSLTVPEPVGVPARRERVEVGDGVRLDTLCVVPAEPCGTLLYYVGFGTALGEREALKCQILADATGCAVATAELPGFAQTGRAMPPDARDDLWRGDSARLARLTTEAIRAALGAAGVAANGPVRLLGYSTGCSLAAHAARDLTGVTSVTLVEPVAIAPRNLVTLQVANTVDAVGYPLAVSQNRRIDKPARLAGAHIRYGVPDLLALAAMLATDELARTGIPAATVSLVRGGRSRLCPADAFARLDAALDSHGIDGVTATVPGLGHQLWHSIPAVAAIAYGIENGTPH